MGCNCLRFSGALEHEQLGEDGNCFQPDREGPENLGEVEFVVEEEGEDEAWPEEVFNFEGVNGRVMGWSGAKKVYIELRPAEGKANRVTDLYLIFMR